MRLFLFLIGQSAGGDVGSTYAVRDVDGTDGIARLSGETAASTAAGARGRNQPDLGRKDLQRAVCHVPWTSERSQKCRRPGNVSRSAAAVPRRRGDGR